MNADAQFVLGEIKKLPSSWHGAGLLPFTVLEAIARCATEVSFRHSLETGCGASTLLLSHLSARHHVFARQYENGSIDSAMASRLLRRESVELVEGPTQRTLPAWKCEEGLEFVLLDGPHGFPSHQLEYYYIYPHL